MKVLLVQIALLALTIHSGCLKQQRVEPSYPSNVQGWKESNERGLTIRGKFVLRKSEMTDNGKIQVKLLDIIPPDLYAEAGTFQRQARARIQLIRMSDQKVLCEDTYAERSAVAFSPQNCSSSASDTTALSEFGIWGLYIIAINLQEGWVFFELRG